MKIRTKGVVAAAAICSTLLLTACDPIGTGSAGSSGGSSGTTTTTAPTTTAPPTTIGGGGNGSGSLALAALAQPTWSDQNGPINIDTMKIIPGDVLTYRGTFKITLNGTNLKARVTTDNVTFTGGQLKTKLQPVVTATINGAPLPAGNIVTTAHNGATVEVTAKFTFDPQTAGTVGQSDTANFQNIGVHLEQVPS
ncbi:alternate-type signal peptide domain-containing protein [Rhodococcus hoagii]|uniref:alternate-type signal peptide domain-containing protein n=1 Tax=Rhodococcus hoagii TaxID=43767 RepID=UPI001962F8E4|nr:alternate-type signal peptide domain-containing protein [Prescottella equi]MBM9838729.1 alternate-type signal peptide domain-containing protein [Prescottella equi]